MDAPLSRRGINAASKEILALFRRTRLTEKGKRPAAATRSAITCANLADAAAINIPRFQAGAPSAARQSAQWRGESRSCSGAAIDRVIEIRLIIVRDIILERTRLFTERLVSCTTWAPLLSPPPSVL